MGKIPIKDRLDILAQQLVRAQIHYQLWWFYVGEATRPKIVDTLNDFPEFFRFDVHAHFVSMIVHCAVVWDGSKSTISLPRLASELLDPQRFSCHRQLQDDVASQNCRASGIVKIRNSAIAHRSELEDYQAVFARAGIVPNELPNLLETWLDLANQLRSIHNPQLAEVEFHELPLNGLRSMIRALGGPNLRPATFLDDVLKP